VTHGPAPAGELSQIVTRAVVYFPRATGPILIYNKTVPDHYARRPPLRAGLYLRFPKETTMFFLG